MYNDKNPNEKDYSIGEWMDIWFEEYALSHLRIDTLQTYKYVRKRAKQINPEIETTKLTDLKSLDFQIGY